MTHRASRIAALILGAGLAVTALAGCASGSGSPTATPTATRTASPAPSPTATPTPTVDPTPTEASVNLPTDCSALGTDATRAAAVGDMTLQSNGEGFVRPAPEGAALALGCDWIVGEASGMLLLISTATPEAVTAAVGTLPGQGYTCQVADDFGAQVCVLPGGGSDTEEVIVARNGVWIYLSTVNRNGWDFLAEIAQGIFA